MAKKWGIKFDPSDHSWAVAKFDTILRGAEKIATFTVEPDAAGVEYGLIIDKTGERAAALDLADTAVKVWLSIDEERQADPKFRNGVLLGVVVTIETDAVPPNTWQRTWQALFLQQ